MPMYPNDLKQQRRTLHIAGLGLYVTCLVCFIGFIVSTYLDDMSFVSFFIGLLGTFIGSILFLALGPRFLKSLGDRNLEFDERSERT
ncbi:hypothetical protein [Seinonella peptonophila]|uniref:hypothetical protein n=1 Tax=Seinonella peptonophila TaxID=112248 RepID=UPI0015874637|nr:hypothetical protein [Seinonella peptonophila]